MKVLVTGAAGLVGQNLIPPLKALGAYQIVAVDKHSTNTRILAELHPDITVVEADLAEPGPWEEHARTCDALIQLHAQIGGLEREEFVRNNETATRRVLDACSAGQCAYLVHVSSSVVNSSADDFYTQTKEAQESIVGQYDIPHIVLRPTLMFGWFDRKHLGWLRRFMTRAPIFPIPGHGRYLRQPLYAGDFSAIIAKCLEGKKTGVFNISGQEKIDYIDMIKMVKEVTSQRTPIVKIPYWSFWSLLWLYALFDRDPPFTTKQLEALITPDVFEVIDWPSEFSVASTPLRAAMEQTYNDPRYGSITLAF